MLLVWTVGIWAVRPKAHLNLPLDKNKHSGEVPRGWTALLHLALKTQRDLSAAGIDPTSLTNDQLRLEIHKRLNGGMVCFESDEHHTKSLPDTITTTIQITRKPEISLGCFLWQKTKELKCLFGVIWTSKSCALEIVRDLSRRSLTSRVDA
ncbi:hypothetical protein B0I37DRAFT_353948 [Chaetomium sp. MPI-CAGE-AT-0009]|nr:hypothetical protein B0I37DRAFT_353948 [Chaetomium sp. MPI-CAGE-AT-0009]